MPYTKYNLTGFENSSSIFDMATSINTASGNVFAGLALLAIFITILMALLQKNPPPESAFAASLVTTILAAFFAWFGWVGWVWPVGSSIVFAGTLIALYKSNSI